MAAESFVIGLANGFMGYLPHKSNFEEPDAQYRYETLMNAMEPAATDVALEVGTRLVSEIRRYWVPALQGRRLRADPGRV